MEEKKCASCGAPIDLNATECKYCGEAAAAQAPPYQAPPYQAPPYQAPPPYNNTTGIPNDKNKIVAGILAIFLGGLGIHKFYLGKTGMGILYLLFFWTFIPAIAGFIEGIIYLCSSDETFYNKYVR